MTLAVTLVAAYGASAIARPALRIPAVALGLGVIALTGAAWAAWPARTLATPTFRVVAVQGNIPQAIKATRDARLLALHRYVAMTDALAPSHPQLVVWPETVILTDIMADTGVRTLFTALARRVGAPVVVGTLARDPITGSLSNVSATFTAAGLTTMVAKRQLVPFAEFLPLPAALRALPGVNEIGNFTSGHGPQLDPRTGGGTLICWESVFGDVALDQVRAGARYFVVATDDAWFGASDGPYQHAQATTLRAVETGRWIVRAASTGISGIVGPDGEWRARSGLETQETVSGALGEPVATAYAAVGPQPIGIACLIVALALVLVPWRLRV
jgi:apolipoprotein N-acyltransferase